MFQIQELPRTDGGTHQRLVSEAFFPQACVTIVASLSYMDRENPDRVTEWRAYWQAFSYPPIIGDADTDFWQGPRIEQTASHGSKLPPAVGKAIFPHVDGPYNY